MFRSFCGKTSFPCVCPRTFVPDSSLQKFGFVCFVRDNLRLATFVSELVTFENILLVVLDSMFLFQSFHFVPVVPETVQLLDKVFGTSVAELVVRNFGITTSVSELLLFWNFNFGTFASQVLICNFGLVIFSSQALCYRTFQNAVSDFTFQNFCFIPFCLS